MDNRFFERPILNSPYAYPVRHLELDNITGLLCSNLSAWMAKIWSSWFGRHKEAPIKGYRNCKGALDGL
jgi:hypothetical protein